MNNQAPGEFYHIYNRGTQKQLIFVSDADRFRFLFLILTLQGKNSIKNPSRIIRASVQNRILHINDELTKEVVKGRGVELVAFCLMPNHFHLILHELEEGGISKYMQRVQIAYTKYFNTKYMKSGHLFQSAYRSKHIADDLYLMHLSAYIHRNPLEILSSRWIEEHEELYYWSSFQDCISKNRFPKLLKPEIIIDRYSDIGEKMTYKKFVKTSLAKEVLTELRELE